MYFRYILGHRCTVALLRYFPAGAVQYLDKSEVTQASTLRTLARLLRSLSAHVGYQIGQKSILRVGADPTTPYPQARLELLLASWG